RAGGLASGLDGDRWGRYRAAISGRRSVPGAALAGRGIGSATGFRTPLVVGRTGDRGGNSGGFAAPGGWRNAMGAAKSATAARWHELAGAWSTPAHPRDEARMGT